ncbi:MAG: cytochrome c family protein [Candidatus Marinimicrobia bacterium]|nr:cytochrome c family protein [Candidatus Neomarinimicrobiota bacterium]
MRIRNILTLLLVLLGMAIGLYALQSESNSDLPKPVILGSLANIFYPVEFSHDTHAHMSEMGTGCETCHHDFEDGDFSPCSDCHSNNPNETDEGQPTLNGAYHRKCMTCHRENEPKVSICSTCHTVSGQAKPEKPEFKYHSPRLSGPEVLTFETPDADEPMVTFHHKEHVNLFRIECSACHHDERCSKCHSYSDTPMNTIAELKEFHVPCESCHETEDEDGCSFCHKSAPSKGFSHSMTGFTLKPFHAKNKCESCHVGQERVERLDKTCTNCHSNFVLGEFDHAATGLVLYEDHQELDCYECHIDNKFDATPQCVECHDDDYRFPDDLPGEYLE